MPTIMNWLWEFNKCGFYKTRLERIQQEALANPQNLIFKVRLGDFWAKLNRTKEAIVGYERTAQEFIRKNLFAQAVALKKIIFRMNPSRNMGEQALILNRLQEQMLESKTESQKIEADTLQGTCPYSQSKGVKISQTPGRVMLLETNPTS